MVPYGAQVILAATKNLGLSEDPVGSNDGPKLRKVLAGSGFQPGEYWCLYFAMQMARFGVPIAYDLWFRLLKHGSTDLLASQAHARNFIGPDYSTGSIFLLYKQTSHGGKDYFHAGIAVEDNGDGTFATIEGNSNNDGSHNGYEVVRHSRRHPSHGGLLDFVYW